MFDSLLNFLGGLWSSFTALVQEIWRQTGVTLGSVWTIVLAVVGLVVWAWDKVGQTLIYLITTLDVLAFPETAAGAVGPLMSWMEVVNRFLPLEEMYAFLITWMTLTIALSTYRLIKSWIPTLS